jgi:hypothetical protein
MLIHIKFAALRDVHWYEFLIRFALGGAMTVIAGAIASRFGPVTGGLFLAFPAIFPASVTLVEKQTRRRKEEKGLRGARRGIEAAALDARGAALGGLGLIGFAGAIFMLIERSTILALAVGTAIWAIIRVLTWWWRGRHL